MAFDVLEIPSSGLLLNALKILCGYSDVLREICVNVIFAISGYDSEQFDRVRRLSKNETSNLFPVSKTIDL